MYSALKWGAVGPVVVVAGVGAALAGCSRAEPRPAVRVVRVAAAADLGDAFREIARDVEASSGAKIELTFGSSGLLAKQIAEGAPFDVFASASPGFVRTATRGGACDDRTSALYARGRLALYCPGGAPEGGLASLGAGGRPGKVAIANPEHAPYGVAAIEALQRLGAHERLRERLVFASNVGECLQFARTGNVDCAFVARSLVRGEPPAQVLDIPEDLHAPIAQTIVLCSGGARPGDRASAEAFVAHVRGERGQRVLTAYGFGRP